MRRSFRALSAIISSLTPRHMVIHPGSPSCLRPRKPPSMAKPLMNCDTVIFEGSSFDVPWVILSMDLTDDDQPFLGNKSDSFSVGWDFPIAFIATIRTARTDRRPATVQVACYCGSIGFRFAASLSSFVILFIIHRCSCVQDAPSIIKVLHRFVCVQDP